LISWVNNYTEFLFNIFLLYLYKAVTPHLIDKNNLVKLES